MAQATAASSLEELVERRGRVAHDLAVERPQRLGDLRPMGIELERIGQKAHAFLVRLERSAAGSARNPPPARRE